MHSGRDTRGLGCAAAAAVVVARGVAGGSLSFSRASGSLLVARAPFGSFLAFFPAVGANPRRPGSVRSVFEWAGGGCAAKWRYKNTRGVLFLLTEGGVILTSALVRHSR